jgi:nitrate/TMAO reductase-like tetraheme cytochrome c subunit
MRWPIARNLLIVLGILGMFTAAAKKRPETSTPEPTPVEPAPVAPPAPKLFPDGPPVAIQALPPGLHNITAQNCNACHGAVHDDWAASAHAHAGSDPVYREAIARAGNTPACTSCHYPLANQHESLAAGYKDGDLTRPELRDNPSWDPSLMSEGVGCAACHIRDGVVISTRAVTNAPHPVAASSELSDPAFCATCHQLTWPGADKPFYDTYGEWSASAYRTAGIRCQDCHMPAKAGLATASRFAASPSHAMSADPRRALSVLVDIPSASVQRGEGFPVKLRIVNTGAGHSVPTGSPYKAYVIEAELLDADGKKLAPPFQLRLERKIADAPPWATLSDDRIAAGGEKDVETSFAVSQKNKAGRGTLQIRLVDGDERWVLQEIPLTVL